MRNDLYKDRFAPDGFIANGWRIVRRSGKVGKVKIGGAMVA